MRTFRISLLSSFQVYHIAVATVVTVYTSTYFSDNWKFVPFDHLHLILKNLPSKPNNKEYMILHS